MKKALLIFGVVVLLGGVGLYIKKTIDLTKKLVYKLVGVRIIQLGLNSTTIEAMLQIKNEGELEVTLKGLNLDVFINKVFISKIKNKQDAVITPNGTIIVPLKVTFSPMQILSNLGNIIGSVDMIENLGFDFNGRITVIWKGIPIIVPFDISSTLGKMKRRDKKTPQ